MYYLCSRIFCFRCNVALTPTQLEEKLKDDGIYKCPECDGEIIKDKLITEKQTVFIRKGKAPKGMPR